MKNMKNNIISFLIISIFVFGLSVAKSASASGGDFTIRSGVSFTQDMGNNQSWSSGTLANGSNGYSSDPFASNPVPVIYSVNPGSGKLNVNDVVTVNGTNFISNSTVRFNSVDHPTTYVNSGILRFQLTASDVSMVGGFPITVVNMGPGGGISNVIVFNITNIQTSNVANTVSSAKSSSGTVAKAKQSNTVAKANTSGSGAGTTNSNSSGTDLAGNGLSANALSANALFGSDGFMPKNFIQWIIVFFLILIIIAIWRRIYYVDKYQSTPLKHA